MPFEWNVFMATGVPEIDKHHQEVFGKINDFIRAIINQTEKDELETLFNFLAEHITYMFQVEEKLLEDMKYPDLVKHKTQHAYFMRIVKDLNGAYDFAGMDERLIMDVHQKICNWITIHMSKTDMLWVNYMKAQKDAAQSPGTEISK